MYPLRRFVWLCEGQIHLLRWYQPYSKFKVIHCIFASPVDQMLFLVLKVVYLIHNFVLSKEEVIQYLDTLEKVLVNFVN